MARPRRTTKKTTTKKTMHAARAKRPCEHCGTLVGANNMARHIASKHPEHVTTPASFKFECSECNFKTNGPAQWGKHKAEEHDGAAVNVATKVVPAKRQTRSAADNASSNGHSRRRSIKVSDEETAVGQYLDALASRNGDDRPRSYFEKRMEKAQVRFMRTTGLARAQAAQEITELQRELDRRPDLSDLEAVFIEHGLVVTGTHGIEYGTLRVLGVPARVLKSAGIGR